MGGAAEAGFVGFKLSAVVTTNAGELGDLLALASRYGAQLRLARLRPAGRGADTWHELRPTAQQLVDVHRFLVDHPEVLTGDSFFHLGALGEPIAGLNLCGAGRVVCLVDPVGDVYAARSSGTHALSFVPAACGSRAVSRASGATRRCSGTCASRRSAAPAPCARRSTRCHGGCMAAKFFTGLPLDGPDPECVLGHGEKALALVGAGTAPSPGAGHSKPASRPAAGRGGVRVALGARRR